jgi:hypothetical protein
MTEEEKIAMKAACIQAAAILVAARFPVDLDNNAVHCPRIAGLLYAQISTINWKISQKTLSSTG